MMLDSANILYVRDKREVAVSGELYVHQLAGRVFSAIISAFSLADVMRIRIQRQIPLDIGRVDDTQFVAGDSSGFLVKVIDMIAR